MNTVEDFVHRKRFKHETGLDKSRCVFSVHEQGRGVGFYQCQKGIAETIEGHGFCKVHAKEVKRRLGIKAETHTKFAAKFLYGEPTILKLSISSETEKTIEVESVETILGNSWGFVIGSQRKDNSHIKNFELFYEKNKAIGYLIDKAEEYVKHCESELQEAEKTYKDLLELWYS